MENCRLNLNFATLTPKFILTLLLLGAWLVPQNVQAQCMAGPGTGDITGNVPFGDPINWANPNRVEISDDLWARAQFNPGQTTKYLWVSDFDFVLPAGATILGIEVNIERHADKLSWVRDASVRLIKNGTIQGSDYAKPPYWSVKDAADFYGGPTDLWGSTWTAADIMSIDFGVVVSATRDSGANNLRAYIDQISMNVYYDDGSGCILSAEITQLTAENEDNSVRLDWSTAKETNTSHFLVERSLDGNHFEPIGNILAAGSSEASQSYTYQDESPSQGFSYYRLNQVDLDGKQTFSAVVEVNRAAPGELNLTAWPNPATDRVQLSIGTNSAFKVEILDLSGRRVYSSDFQAGERADIQLSGFQRGLYLVKVTGVGLRSETQKLLLQ